MPLFEALSFTCISNILLATDKETDISITQRCRPRFACLVILRSEIDFPVCDAVDLVPQLTDWQKAHLGDLTARHDSVNFEPETK